MIKSNSHQVVIYGSYVSRDVFNFPEADAFEITKYYARSSLASLYSPVVKEDAYSDNLASSFQQRLVRTDLKKHFVEEIGMLGYDLLLLDLIDERFDLFVFDDGAICTLSNELVTAGFDPANNKGRVVKSGSDEFYALWERGWENFLAHLKMLDLAQRLFVHKTFWSFHDAQGNDYRAHSAKSVQNANAFLERLYRRIERDLPPTQFIEADRNYGVGAVEHRWGRSPFRFIDEYYKDLAAVLQKTAVDLCRDRKPVVPQKAYDPYALHRPVFRHASIDAALDDGLQKNGIHQIHLTERQNLDLCIQGLEYLDQNPQSSCTLLVGFSGAVSKRQGKRAPFFSGLGIAQSLKLPIVAVSDPTLALATDLPIGWYAGNEEVPDFPVRLAKVLDALAARCKAKLLIFGGSGGGFASLLQGTLLSAEATVCTWNPQTAIEDYAPRFVDDFINVAFSKKKCVWVENKKFDILQALMHDVRVLSLRPNVKLLYLQNQSDWHVKTHTLPYVSNKSLKRLGRASFIEQNNPNFALFFGNWGEGHIAPSKSVLKDTLQKLAEGYSVKEIVQELDDGLDGICESSSYFELLVEDNFATIEAEAFCDTKQIHAICLTRSKNIKYAFYLLVDGKRHSIRWYEPIPEVYFEIGDIKGKFEIVAFLETINGKRTSVRIPVKMKPSYNFTEIDYKDNSSIYTSEAAEFARQLVANTVEVADVRTDWKLCFSDFEIERLFSGEIVLFSGGIVAFGDDFDVDWTYVFEESSASNLLWFYSLNYVGTLLTTYEKIHQIELLEVAIKIAWSFLIFIDASDENRKMVLTSCGGGSIDHAMAIRTNVFVKFIQVLTKTDLSLDLANKLALFLYSHALFMLDDNNYKQNNHGVMVDLALAQLGAALGVSTELGKLCIEKSSSRLAHAMQNIFDRDGLANENTIGYHRFNVKLFEEGVLWFNKWDPDSKFVQIASPFLKKANTALSYCIWQDGSIPPIGDSAIYEDVAPSINKSYFFPESHFGVIKNDDLYVSIICGCRGKAHKHVDDTAITIRYQNFDIVIDGGSYNYDAKNPYRQCLQSNFGHSGIFLTSIDAMTPSEYLKTEPVAKIKEWVEDSSGVSVTTEITFKQWGATLQRKIKVLWPNRIFIQDRVEIEKGYDPMTARQSWLLGRKMKIRSVDEESEKEQFIVENEFISAKFEFDHPHNNDSWTEFYCGATKPKARGWCSEKFGKIMPTMELSKYATGTIMDFNVEIVINEKK